MDTLYNPHSAQPVESPYTVRKRAQMQHNGGREAVKPQGSKSMQFIANWMPRQSVPYSGLHNGLIEGDDY